MKICVLGHTGFVGQTIYSLLSKKHKVCGINSKTNYIPTEEFDVVINCAGNAKKYLATRNPAKDFFINTNIFNTILQMKMKKFIHISSIDASKTPNNNYTISKLISEECSKLYFPKSVILRLGGMVGHGLKKNVVFDISKNKDLYVTYDSICNYISIKEVANIVKKIIEMDINSKTVNIASSKPIAVKEIIEIANRKSILFNKSEGYLKETYDNIDLEELNSFFCVKDSYYYIKEYLNLIK